MASKQHDFILSLVIRKIRTLGFTIAYQDGKFQDNGISKYEIPPRIIHHKPDVIGKNENSLFCIGEAKTKNDIFTLRTENQIKDFLELVKTNPGNKLIIGIPADETTSLSRLMQRIGVENNTQIEIIRVPKELFPYEEEL
jgi:hypothetical protein